MPNFQTIAVCSFCHKTFRVYIRSGKIIQQCPHCQYKNSFCPNCHADISFLIKDEFIYQKCPHCQFALIKCFSCDNVLAVNCSDHNANFSCPHCHKQFLMNWIYGLSLCYVSVTTCISVACNQNPLAPTHIYYPLDVVDHNIRHNSPFQVYCLHCQCVQRYRLTQREALNCYVPISKESFANFSSD